MSKLQTALDVLVEFFLRFRFPCSLPSEIGDSLGVEFSRYPTFPEMIDDISHCTPTRLYKYMPRDEAEELFRTAQKKEQFVSSSLFSYYFNEGWVEFVLYFDEQSRLRRLYFQHKSIEQDEGIEIPLTP